MPAPTQSERREALQRALDSTELRRSAKLRQLLSYICAEDRAGHPEQLTEREIGVAVFGRPEHYDSNADNIVRVQARNLRKRLQSFYAGDGAEDRVRIQIPKGHYLPVFARHETAPGRGPAANNPPRRTAAIAAAALAIVLSGFLAGRYSGPIGSAAAAEARSEAAHIHAPWSEILRPGEPSMLVVSDNTFSMSQRLLGRSVTLDDYLAGGVEFQYRARAVLPRPIRQERDDFDLIAWREQTSFTSLSKAIEIARLAGPLADSMEIQFPRDLHARDIVGKSVILLGSKRCLPWIELYEPRLNFHYRYDEARGAPYFENVNPLHGELPRYQRGGPDGSSSETYSHLALLPNLDAAGVVLIISGAGDSAQSALANHLLNPAEARRILLEIGVDPDHPGAFEAVLRSSRIHGAGNTAEVVASRVYEPMQSTRLSRAR